MADISNLCVYTVQRGDKWLVATNQSPYFCFEAASERAALDKASAALVFYKRAQSHLNVEQGGREPVAWDWRALPAERLVAA